MLAGLRWSNSVTGLSSTAGLGSSMCFFPDVMLTPFAVSVQVTVNSSAVIFNVEGTLDYVGQSSAFTSTAATWFSSLVSAATSNVLAAITTPISALRLNVTSGSSTGSVTLTALQAGGV